MCSAIFYLISNELLHAIYLMCLSYYDEEKEEIQTNILYVNQKWLDQILCVR